MEVREGFVQSEGHSLAFLAVNEHLAKDNQPCIVFIHGVLASVNFWRDCVPESFKEARAWYSLSLPAHHPSGVPEGFSPEHVNEQWFYQIMNGALRELLGDRKAIIVGHSTGGFCALNLAINHSPNVIGIVSIAGFHSGKWGGVEGLLVKLAGLGKWAKPLFEYNIVLAQRSGFIQRTFASLLAYRRSTYRSNPLSQRMIENIQQNTRQQDPGALFPLFNGISSLEIADQLQQIKMPCYLFVGSHDPVVTTEQSLVLANNIPHGKTVVFKGVGHMPFMEDTDTYYRSLERAISDINTQCKFRITEEESHELSPI